MPNIQRYKLFSYLEGRLTYVFEDDTLELIQDYLGERLYYRVDRDGQVIDSDPTMALRDMLKGKTVFNASISILS